MLKIGSEMKILIVMLLVIGIWYSSVAYGKQMTWDEAAHANAALFTQRLGGYVLENGFSLQGVGDFSADYHMHYKVYNMIASYPPFYYMAMVPFIALFGSWILLTKILVIIEALIVLFFVFKIAGLYGRGRLFPFACVLFLALQPVFIDIATRNYLDMGLIMFTLGGFYFFVKFMRFEKGRDLYLAGAFLGLSVLAKPMFMVIFPLLLLVMAWERKLHLFRRHWAGFAKGLVILVVCASPFIAQQALLSMECTGDLCGIDKYLSKWSTAGVSGKLLPSPGLGEPVLAFDSHLKLRELSFRCEEVTDFQNFTKNLSGFLFQFYLIPFFIIGFFIAIKRGNEINRYSVLIFLVMLYILAVITDLSTLKYTTLVIPFVVLLSVNGMFAFFGSRRLRGFQSLLYPLLALFLIFSLFQSIAYLHSTRDYITGVDRYEVGRYVLGQVEEPSSVLVSFASSQTFSFAMLEDSERKIYSLYIPRKKAELEMALAGNFSFAGSEGWEKAGISYPKPGFAVIYEIRLRGCSFDYDIEYFLSQPERFETLRVFNEENPGDRAFIFKLL